MKVIVLGVVMAFLFSASAAYLVIHPAGTPAAAGASISAQTSSILFDTTRIVELLKALLAKTPSPAPQPFIPSIGTTTLPFAPASTTQNTKTSAKTAPAKVIAPKPVPVPAMSVETKLALVLPSLRSALVNIVCLPNKSGTGLRGVSGTGVIIDPRGFILTVAHVAQYEVLAAARPDLVTCVVRTGSPATPAYLAKPVFISSDWIDDNVKNISASDPKGSGENDFALLAITDTATKTPLPASFPYVPIASNVASVKDGVVIGSYGAEFLTSATIRSGIFPTLVFGSVQDRYTFDTDTIDVISLGGGAAAQEGSSGGGAVNQDGQLIGLITTRSNGDSLASRDLRAITNTYLQRAFREQAGASISAYLQPGPAAVVSSYASQASRITSQLIKANRIGN